MYFNKNVGRLPDFVEPFVERTLKNNNNIFFLPNATVNVYYHRLIKKFKKKKMPVTKP